MGAAWAAKPEALARVLGHASAIGRLLTSTREMMLEALRADLEGRRIDPFDPRLRQYLVASMGSLPDEMLRIFFVDGGGRLVSDETLQNGTLAQLAVYPRTIFRRALELNAAGVILVHNHPSGDPAPSDADVETTERLAQIGRSLDIKIIDHIIVGASQVRHIGPKNPTSSDDHAGSAFPLRATSPDQDEGSLALANAKRALRRRILRRQLLGHDALFGEPAWDMLIDLFIHQGEGKPVSTSSICIASGVPITTALRLLQRLCEVGLLIRAADPDDGRRNLVRIAPNVAHRLTAFFAAGDE